MKILLAPFGLLCLGVFLVIFVPGVEVGDKIPRSLRKGTGPTGVSVFWILRPSDCTICQSTIPQLRESLEQNVAPPRLFAVVLGDSVKSVRRYFQNNRLPIGVLSLTRRTHRVEHPGDLGIGELISGRKESRHTLSELGHTLTEYEHPSRVNQNRRQDCR